MKSTARVLSLVILLLATQKTVLSIEFEIKVPTLSVAGPEDSQPSEAAPAASRDTPFVETPGETQTKNGSRALLVQERSIMFHKYSQLLQTLP